MIVELREWSRISDDLQQERNRLANRVREQLWRYYPQMLKLPHDFADEWFLDLWSQAPTTGEGGADAREHDSSGSSRRTVSAAGKPPRSRGS